LAGCAIEHALAGDQVEAWCDRIPKDVVERGGGGRVRGRLRNGETQLVAIPGRYQDFVARLQRIEPVEDGWSGRRIEVSGDDGIPRRPWGHTWLIPRHVAVAGWHTHLPCRIIAHWFDTRIDADCRDTESYRCRNLLDWPGCRQGEWCRARRWRCGRR
jgi:hypothetical protein